MAEKSAITLLSYLKVEGSVDCEVIGEKGYKMRKEYLKPDAELVKFVEEEEIMANGLDAALDITKFNSYGTNSAVLD
ncbi:MAG: hypothetical protein IKK03_16220 [Lachnospiraceae bacterium]|nr:hypothetical protein [Lachnospiraceae bacterium]